MHFPVLVLSSAETPNFLVQRTIRKLIQAGADRASVFQLPELANRKHNLKDNPLDTASGVMLIQAGCWPRFSQPLLVPPVSASGRPIVALGAVCSNQDCLSAGRSKGKPNEHAGDQASDEHDSRWDRLLQFSGGDLQGPACRQQLETLNQAVWIDGRLAADFAQQVLRLGYNNAWRELLQREELRLIHWQPMDVYFDRNLRAAQVITSLQRGGAERIAIDLHRCWLRSNHVSPLLIAVNAPSRKAFPTPPATIELSQLHPRTERWQRCETILNHFAADVIHTHLLSRNEHQLIRNAGGRVLATIHNARSGWQSGTEQFDDQDLDLVVACSQAVERDLKSAGVQVPTRTVWNGINLGEFQVDPALRSDSRSRLLKQYHLPTNSILVAALANPRPQKRLERLPAILSLAEQQLSSVNETRPIHLLLAGEPSQGNRLAEQAMQQIHEQISKWGLGDRVHWLGCVEDSRDLLAGIDIVISPSDFEGLSLAHLEALSCGTRVVANDVGGTSEIAFRCDGIHLVSAQSDDIEFATQLSQAIEKLSIPLEATPTALQRDFSLIRMRDGYLRMYERLANQPLATIADKPKLVTTAHKGQTPSGVLLITNNFSTGGAQSSARRLLIALKAQGYSVRAAVLQEDLDNPTPGRQSLTQHAIEVLCLPKAGNIDPLTALRPLFDSLDKAPPECILLWNVIPEYKMLIADSLWNTRLFDVSPGEMNLQSLERYFQNPRPGLPYRSLKDYGQRLAGAVVKYSAECPLVEQALRTSVTVIPNGVPIPQDSSLLVPKAKVVIGTAARISPQKRFEDLFEAFRLVHEKLPEYELQIAGGVERGAEKYFSELQQQTLGLPIRWVGELADTQPFLLQLDLFVMISEPAGCPNASLEAMAAGLPIVATDFGGVSEQVVDQFNGLLVPNRDPDAFGKAIEKLVSDASLRQRFGAASRQRAIELFSVERMTRDYISLMQLDQSATV